MTMRTSWRFELPQLLIVGGLLVWAGLLWANSSDIRLIPIRWDAQGQVTGYSGRFQALVMIPLVTLAIYLLLRFAPLVDPLRTNYRLFGDVYAIIRLAIFAFLASAALRSTVAITLIVAFAVAASVGLVIYSYLVWRTDPNRSLALLSRSADDQA